MNESEILSLLAISKDVAKEIVTLLNNNQEETLKKYRYIPDLPREMKSDADRFLDKELIKRLSPLGISILSEEGGEINSKSKSSFRFIIDPLDGTVNYVRGLSQSSISIALYDDKKPVFGVLAIYPSEEIVWGGKNFGAFLGEEPINVSDTEVISNAVLCTGFPSHFDVSDQKALSKYFDLIGNFGKIRMLGSASISLFNVARGAADCYYEQEIMIWDVAAGIAILEGAGGVVSVSPGRFDNSLNVVASNGTIKFNFIEGQ